MQGIESSALPFSLANRFAPAGADGWVQLSPYGAFPKSVDGVLWIQNVDQASAAAMVNRWKAAGAERLLVDYDHFAEDPQKSSEAAGWISDLAARDDGLYGRIDWTDTGELALRNGRYRFLSPLWLAAPVAGSGDTNVRPVTLLGAGLTNKPNLPIKALSNRAGESTNNTMNEVLKKITARLGLPEDADEKTILAALPKLANSADMQTRIEALETKLANTERERDQLRTATIEADLQRYADVIGDKTETVKLLLAANREGTVAFLDSLQAGKRGTGMTERNPPANPGTPLANRSGDDATRAATIEGKVREYRIANRGCSYRDAHNAVRASHPELFTTDKE